MQFNPKDPIKIHGYSKPERVKAFITPDTLSGPQGKGSVKNIAQNLAKSLFARVNQIIHRILKSEWITNESIYRSINVSIVELSKDLTAQHYHSRDDLDQKLEVRTWIHDSVVSLRRVCDQLKANGVDVEKLVEGLDDLDRINDQERIKEVEEWKDSDLRTRIHEQLATFIFVAYNTESVRKPREEKAVSLLEDRLGGEGSPQNEELIRLAEVDLSDKHYLFVVDQVRRAWDLILTGYKPKGPPNKVLIEYTKVKELVGQLPDSQKTTERGSSFSLEHLQTIHDESELRKIAKEIMQEILTDKNLPPSGWFTRENPILRRIKSQNYVEKAPVELLAKDINELQRILNEVYRQKGEHVSDQLYDNFAALYVIFESLKAPHLAPHHLDQAQEAKEKVEINVPPIPQTEEELRVLFEETLTAFIRQAYGDKIVPGTEPPVSYLEKQLTPALNKELRAIEQTDFKNAHYLHLVAQTNRAIEIVRQGFAKHPIPKEVNEQMGVTLYLLNALSRVKKVPDIQHLDQNSLRLGLQDFMKQIINFEKASLAQGKDRGKMNPTFDQLLVNSNAFIDMAPELIAENIKILFQVIEQESRKHGVPVPHSIYNSLVVMNEMCLRLNILVQLDRQAAIHTAVVPQPNPLQQKERQIILKELSNLISKAYEEHLLLPKNSKEPVSRVMWELGGKEGYNSVKNQELLRMQSLLNEGEGDYHNLFVINQVYRARQLLLEVYKKESYILPKEIKKNFKEILKKIKSLDNSQKGPLLPQIKPIHEIQAIKAPTELREVIQQQLDSLISLLKSGGLFQGKIFPGASREDNVLNMMKRKKFPAAQIFNMVSKLNDKIDEAFRDKGDPPDFVYDFLAAIYEALERLEEVEKKAEPSSPNEN